MILNCKIQIVYNPVRYLNFSQTINETILNGAILIHYIKNYLIFIKYIKFYYLWKKSFIYSKDSFIFNYIIKTLQNTSLINGCHNSCFY